MAQTKTVELELPFQVDFLPVTAECVENSVRAFGLGRAEAMHLRLAVEEVYAFLVRRAMADQILKLECRHGGYYAEVVCHFPGQGLPVGAFNITSTISSDDEESLSEMGLLLAARTIDRLEIEAESGVIRIHFIKEKLYPAAVDEADHSSIPGRCREIDPSAEMLKQFANKIVGRYGARAPEFFHYPGKVADMVEYGEYGAALLADEKGRVAAGMFWRCGNKLAEAFGPYIFSDSENLAVQAVEACLRRLARTSLVCMVVQEPTPEMPAGYFEDLSEGGAVLYRQLEEDNGAVSYVHPDLAAFLQSRYRKLCLPREVHPVEHQGESQSLSSAFAARMNRAAGKATLTPLWVGQDAERVLREHVRALTEEGFAQIMFRLDTGEAGQALLGPALAAAGFVPLWVLPWGGRGDVLTLAHCKEGVR